MDSFIRAICIISTSCRSALSGSGDAGIRADVVEDGVLRLPVRGGGGTGRIGGGTGAVLDLLRLGPASEFDMTDMVATNDVPVEVVVVRELVSDSAADRGPLFPDRLLVLAPAVLTVPDDLERRERTEGALFRVAPRVEGYMDAPPASAAAAAACRALYRSARSAIESGLV